MDDSDKDKDKGEFKRRYDRDDWFCGSMPAPYYYGTRSSPTGEGFQRGKPRPPKTD